MMSPRQKAKAEGLTTYLGSKPCHKGHLGLRYTNNAGCCECNKLRRHPKRSEYNRRWKEKNKEHYKETVRAYQKRISHIRAMRQKEREAAKANATFITNKEWHEFVMEEAYELARLRTHVTGVKHHVDHIVPLNGETVCGFHSWNNIRVIPARENIQKSNKLIEELAWQAI